MAASPSVELAPSRVRDLTASGIRLRVVERGAGPPVVLLHGLFTDHKTWDPLAAALASEFTLIAPDLPGSGESEKPAPGRFPYGVDAFTGAIADLYAGLDVGRAAVIGHGLGGAVALTLAARHPELVSRLVLVDALCEAARPWVYGKLAHVPALGGLVFKQLLGRSLFGAYFRELMLADRARLSDAKLDEYYRSFNTPAARGSALAALRATGDARPVLARTSRVQTPTLVIWGRSDRLIPASSGQRLARAIRGARFELLDAGHAPHEECPAEFARAVRRFLTD